MIPTYKQIMITFFETTSNNLMIKNDLFKIFHENGVSSCVERRVAVLYGVQYVPCTVLRTTLLTPPVHCIMCTS